MMESLVRGLSKTSVGSVAETTQLAMSSVETTQKPTCQLAIIKHLKYQRVLCISMSQKWPKAEITWVSEDEIVPCVPEKAGTNVCVNNSQSISRTFI